MVILLYLVFLCSNFLLTKSEDADMTIDVREDRNCSTDHGGYTFTAGQKVKLGVTPQKHINYGWCELISTTGARNLSSELKTPKNASTATFSDTVLVDQSMEGTWQFTFYFNKGVNQVNMPIIRHYDAEYTKSVCTTNVIIASSSTPTPHPPGQSSSDKRLLIIASVVGAVLSAIIIAQAAYIFFLKAKARKLITINTHNNLSKTSKPVADDTARYCSNPGQKMMKVATPVDDDSRDSVIYEAPNIEISGNARMHPPQPPAINTIPRTPRSDHNMKIGPEAMLASALNSPARSPIFPPNFQRPQHEREISVANRPPLPLPIQAHPHQGHPRNNMFQEVYEEMQTEDNTYEPPPIVNTMPPRLPMPPKKVPTGNLLDVKENTLKMRQGNKPLVTPKPQLLRSNAMPKLNPGHMSPMQQELSIRRRANGDVQTNELDEVLRRRNNAPPPVVKTKPRRPPVHLPVQEEIYYNENQASSDEEWTYEPLKPLKSYDPNIYN